jgi:hypothetical protein
MLGLKASVRTLRWARHLGIPASMFDTLRMVFRKT